MQILGKTARHLNRRGLSLVEEVCAVLILCIAVLGLAAVIGGSRIAVNTTNEQEVAEAGAQQMADTLLAAISSEEEVPVTRALATAADAFYKGETESEFSYTAGQERQFVLQKEENGGYRIITRVYYNGGSRCAQMQAYASHTNGAFNT